MAWIAAPHEDDWEGRPPDMRDGVGDPGHGRLDWIL